MKHLYYKATYNEYYKVGILGIPDGWNPTPIEKAGVPVENIEKLILTLKYGGYADLMLSEGIAYVVSPRLKELFERYGADPALLEFYPVKVVSEQYGDRIYYLLHFTRWCDVRNEKMTRFMPRSKYPARMVLDYEKVHGMSIFNSDSYQPEFLVSDEVRRAIKREKMNVGIAFDPVECSGVPEELQKKGYACANPHKPIWKCLSFPNGKIW
ncbi:DUF1629 domain-containing protein [uncultured Muribaculum sp.]|uniref:imm11 family protein n=1 Tax=uncultured Muribaculum sp. TaxID=1918613 RepID=UPI00261274DE|nr:DUF1629 domain-containing protein [uncultured Muribaculum sp.]